MTTFTQFILDAEVTDDPRGDFIEDTQSLIDAGRFDDPKTCDELLAQVRRRRGCVAAERAARELWAEHELGQTSDRPSGGQPPTPSPNRHLDAASGSIIEPGRSARVAAQRGRNPGPPDRQMRSPR